MSEISILGGITADIEGLPYGKLMYGESNPGKVSMSYGGVGRNIAENLARMGTSVSFASIAGDDFPGRGAVRELSELGVNVDQVRLLPEENTAVYMSILNIVGDMELALNNMDIFERISYDFIDDVIKKMQQSKAVGIDTNLTEEALDYATRKLKGLPIFLDPVSAAKAERAKNIIGRFHTIMPNRMEAEVLTGMNILSEEELQKGGQWFLQQGVKNIFITLAAGGVFYMNDQESGFIRPKEVKIASTTGAGDAFSAGVIHSFVKGLDIKAAAEFGMAAASIAMESKSAVSPNMSEKNIVDRIG